MEDKFNIESNRAAKQLLQTLKRQESIKSKDDKEFIKEHGKRKFT